MTPAGPHARDAPRGRRRRRDLRAGRRAPAADAARVRPPRSSCWSSAAVSAACCGPSTWRACPTTSARRRSWPAGPRCRALLAELGLRRGPWCTRRRAAASVRAGGRTVRCPAARCSACRRARRGWTGCSRRPAPAAVAAEPTGRCAGTRGPMWRSERCCASGSATSWSTGSSIRCSAGSTPVASTRWACAPRCPHSPRRWTRGAASLTAAADRPTADRRTPRPSTAGSGGPVFGALRGGYRGARSTPWSPRPRPRSGSAPPSASWTGARAAGGWCSARRPRPSRWTSTPSCSPSPRPRWPGCSPVAPPAAAAARQIELASSVVVALAYRPGTPPRLPATSGVLVAAGEPVSVKGRHPLDTKWPHLAPDGLVRLRASLGRFGEAATLQVDDAELVARVRADLAVLTGITAAPVDVHVQRWGGGLPQYAVGHLDRVRGDRGRPAARPRGGGGGAARGRRPGVRRHGAGGGGAAGRAARRAERLAAGARRDGSMDAMARLDYAALNSTIRYTMWSVFRVEPGRPRRGPGRGRRADRRFPRRARRARASSSAASTTSPACAPTPTT